MANKSTILLVDDEPAFSQAMQAALIRKSHVVVTAGSRSEAQDMARNEKPDLVILGTIMPRGDAYLFHLWLRKSPSFRDVPLIIVDAPREKQLMRGWRKLEGMQCEADDFFCRPITPEALLPRIEKLLDRVTRKIAVLVADDHAMVREGIRAVLAIQRDIEVVGEAVNGKEALEKTIRLNPDVVLMDIVMPEMNGLDATKQISRQCPLCKILMLTQYNDEENVLASSQAGALGFIAKTAVSAQLLDGIRSVDQGKRFVHSAA